VTGTRPREIGHLNLPLMPKRWGAGGRPLRSGRKRATLRVCIDGPDVLLQIGFEEVALDVEARDHFARMWMEAERAAEAQAGAAP
jgi:hypothetical protein